jgi:hypothetical protein
MAVCQIKGLVEVDDGRFAVNKAERLLLLGRTFTGQITREVVVDCFVHSRFDDTLLRVDVDFAFLVDVGVVEAFFALLKLVFSRRCMD